MNIKNLNIISAKEAAILINVSIMRFHRLVKIYDIPYLKLSCGMIFLKKDILIFQEKRREKLKHRREK